MPDDHDKIDEIQHELAKQGSFRHKLWSGIVFGIGSTLGVAVILYVAVLFVHQLQGLPLVGNFFGTVVSPTLEKSLEDKVPSFPESQTKPSPAEPEPTTTSTDASTSTGATEVSTSLFALTRPAGWDVTLEEGNKGVQRSRLQTESDDFTSHTDESADGPFTPIFYDDGASLDVHVTVGSEQLDHGAIVSTKTVTVDGVSGTYHVFSEPSTQAGQQLDVHLERNNLAYTFTFTYNPDKDPNGPQIFDEILASFTFAE